MTVSFGNGARVIGVGCVFSWLLLCLPGSGLWGHAVAAATTCLFGFLRSGEITTPSLSGYDPQSHLS